MSNGITHQGASTEAKLESLVRIAKQNPDKSPAGKAKGDVIYTYNNQQYYGEVKKETWNQTRPYKYVVCVGYSPKNDFWVVVPPDDVMKMAYGRKGQHTKNSFVCVGLGKTDAKKFTKYRCTSSQLEQKIKDAIDQGDANIEMKKAAKILMEREEARVKEDQNFVGNILEQINRQTP
jgi:hypothetical protein